MKFAWAEGSKISLDPGSAGPELLRLKRKRHGAELKRRHVLEAARVESSPLHPQFKWDDAEAAELYRLEQAGYLLRSILVVNEATNEATHLFAHVTASTVDGYMTTAEVVSDEEMRQAALGEILAQIDGLLRRKSELKVALLPIQRAVAKVRQKALAAT